jgi:primosomal protein N' (replication factor Y)
MRVPDRCPECGSPYIKHFGIGTEKLEEAAKEAFPEAVTARLDLDTAKKKGEADKILNSFRRRRTDILVGTQLVAKGLDFDNVGVVGIISADITLNVPDYRSAERTFQLIVQASGRAGRGDKAGNVVIQTYSPDDKTILAAAESDYDRFYRHEIRMRSLAEYPPFTNIIRLVFSAENEDNVRWDAERTYHKIAESRISKRMHVLSPHPAYMAKMNGVYRYHIIIKSPTDMTEQYLKLISEIKDERISSGNSKSTMLVEVDPYSFT